MPDTALPMTARCMMNTKASDLITSSLSLAYGLKKTSRMLPPFCTRNTRNIAASCPVAYFFLKYWKRCRGFPEKVQKKMRQDWLMEVKFLEQLIERWV